MKIALSKSQWEKIGKKAGWIGWMKTANELSKEITPVDQMLGRTTPGMNEDQIDDFMHSKGYFLFRENYHFGRMLSYMSKQNDKIYFLDGEWMKWDDVKKVLQRTWRPVGQAELKWYQENVAS